MLLQNCSNEVLTAIFSYLDQEDVSLRVALVCKRFHLVTKSYQLLPKSVEFQCLTTIGKLYSFMSMISINPRLEKLVLKNQGYSVNKILRMVAPNGTLGHLEVQISRNNVWTEPLIAISKCHNLKKLHLEGFYNPNYRNEDLPIINMNGLASLSNLRCLSLENISNMDLGYVIEAANFPHLNEIQFSGVYELTDNDVSRIAQTYGKQLKKWTFYGCQLVKYTGIKAVIDHCEDLCYFKLTSREGLTKEEENFITEQLSQHGRKVELDINKFPSSDSDSDCDSVSDSDDDQNSRSFEIRRPRLLVRHPVHSIFGPALLHDSLICRY